MLQPRSSVRAVLRDGHGLPKIDWAATLPFLLSHLQEGQTGLPHASLPQIHVSVACLQKLCIVSLFTSFKSADTSSSTALNGDEIGTDRSSG